MKDKERNNKHRLAHIQKAISDIERFLQTADEEKFISDELLHNAVLMQFMIIGEAIVHVDDAILMKYDYPWYKVRSFRNLIAHEYFNIKISAVWDITQNELTVLQAVINEMLMNEF